jgi:hypothetical protein
MIEIKWNIYSSWEILILKNIKICTTEDNSILTFVLYMKGVK